MHEVMNYVQDFERQSLYIHYLGLGEIFLYVRPNTAFKIPRTVNIIFRPEKDDLQIVEPFVERIFVIFYYKYDPFFAKCQMSCKKDDGFTC